MLNHDVNHCTVQMDEKKQLTVRLPITIYDYINTFFGKMES